MARLIDSHMNNDAAITSPAGGIAGTVTGALTYAACKFVKGASSGGNTGIYWKFSPTIGSALTVQFWIKWGHDNAFGGGNPYLTKDGGNAFNLQEWAAAVYPDIGGFDQGQFTYPAYSAGDVAHVVFVFNKAASPKLKMYYNGVPVVLDAYWGPAGYSEAACSFRCYDDDSIIENLRVDDGELSDFTDRLWWDWTGVPTNLLASQGTYDNRVALSWDTVIGDTVEYRVQRADTSGGSYADLSGWQAGTTYDDTTTVLGTHYFYKVQSRTSLADSALGSEAEGWTSPSAPAIVYRYPSKQMQRVLLTANEYDIFSNGYITNAFSTVEERTFMRNHILLNSFDIVVKNFNNVFSYNNPKSIFSGRDLLQPIKIYDYSGRLIFQGFTRDIARDHLSKTATLRVVDELDQYVARKVEYVSAAWETPAAAFKNMCDANGVSFYNAGSVARSDALLTAAGVYIRVSVSKSDNVGVLSFMEKLGLMGCADVYMHANEVWYRVWLTFANNGLPVDASFGPKDLIGSPKISFMFTEMVNQYRIGYSGSGVSPATDDALGNIGAASRALYGTQDLSEFQCDDKDQIVLKDVTGAQYIGEAYVRRCHYMLSTRPTPIQQVEFSLKIQASSYVTVNSYIRLTFPDEGWTAKLFEVMRVETNPTTNLMHVTAYEVDENA